MKKFFFSILIILLSFFVLSCEHELNNFGTFDISDNITVSYDGYNSSLSDIDKLNTDIGTTIKLYGGEGSFEYLLFDFAEEQNIKAIRIKFDDTFSSPDNNCYFSILYNTTNRIYQYSGASQLKQFMNIQELPINKTCNNIKIFFSSNDSKIETRIIKIFSIDFLLN